MKPIRLIGAFVFFVAAAVSATVFQPASDRQLVDGSDTVVVATVRDVTARVRSDGYLITDCRLDIEQTLKGTAAGTITVSEIGAEASQLGSGSAVYSRGEHVLVFLNTHSDGTYFTTSRATGKFSFTLNTAGEAVLTRDVSEPRSDPARDANAFVRFVRDAAHEVVSGKRSTTSLDVGTDCVAPNSVSISGGGAVPSGQTATLIASVAGSEGPFTYAWFEGFAPDTSHPVGVNPMAPSSSTFTTPAITTTKYYWARVSDACGSATAGTIVYPQEACTRPSIVTQSNSQTIASGSTATLTINATGTSPLSYQWYEATSTADTSKPVGGNSPMFTTPALTQSTSYWGRVANACSTANSNVITISIKEACTKSMFTLQPSAGTGSAGPSIIGILVHLNQQGVPQATYLPASASGATSYQWYKGKAGDRSSPIATDAMWIFDRWGNQVYIDLLGRRPSASELSTLNRLLATGTSRQEIASFLLRSSEYQQLLLTDFYSRLLRRNSTDAERSAAVKGDPPVLEGDTTLVQILASPEYFALAGGTNPGWVDLIFNDVLGRAPSASEVINFTKLLISTSRTTVSLTILNSSEAIDGLVQESYRLLLRRPASPAELRGIVFGGAAAGIIVGGHTMIAMLLGSDEYSNFGTVIPVDIGTIVNDDGMQSYWVQAFNSCGPTDSDTAVLTNRQCTAPVIARQPQNVTVNTGTPASVAVLASVATAYQYQWYRGASGDQSNPITGAIGPVLTMTPTLGGSTQYWVKLWNPCGSTNSNTLTITALQQRRRATSRK